MSMKTEMKIEELKSLIANCIRNENLHESLPEGAIEKIKERILARNSNSSVQEIPEVVNENSPNINTDDRKFPDDRNLATSPNNQQDLGADTAPKVDVPAGAVPINPPMEPTMGYQPELPEMLQKAEPGEIFVFDYNEVGESGENLSLKPMRLMDDPDVKKSMNDFWIQEGKTKAVVYVAKFEKMGEIEFNYADGTSQFTETAALPDHAGGAEYKDNPYMPDATPQIDGATQNDLETYIKTSIDLDQVVHDIVMNIVKDSLLTNTEKAVNDPVGEIGDEGIPGMNEDIAAREDRPGFGADVAQLVKPMEEEFTLSMGEIAEGDKYQKVDLPEELNEAIKSGDKKLLIVENEDMQKWEFGDTTYYTPVNRLSKTKGYIKS